MWLQLRYRKIGPYTVYGTPMRKYVYLYSSSHSVKQDILIIYSFSRGMQSMQLLLNSEQVYNYSKI